MAVESIDTKLHQEYEMSMKVKCILQIKSDILMNDLPSYTINISTDLKFSHQPYTSNSSETEIKEVQGQTFHLHALAVGTSRVLDRRATFIANIAQHFFNHVETNTAHTERAVDDCIVDCLACPYRKN